MADAGAISVEQLVKLSGLTDRRLRELADEGWFPRPVRNQYPLVEAIAGLLRHYRDQHDNPPIRDVYPSFEACAASTGIPVGLLKRAKRQGCSALSGNQVEITGIPQGAETGPDPSVLLRIRGCRRETPLGILHGSLG